MNPLVDSRCPRCNGPLIEIDGLGRTVEAAYGSRFAPASIYRASEASVLKNNLARSILASACTGERDTERLKQIALRAVLSKRRNNQPEPAH